MSRVLVVRPNFASLSRVFVPDPLLIFSSYIVSVCLERRVVSKRAIRRLSSTARRLLFCHSTLFSPITRYLLFCSSAQHVNPCFRTPSLENARMFVLVFSLIPRLSVTGARGLREMRGSGRRARGRTREAEISVLRSMEPFGAEEVPFGHHPPALSLVRRLSFPMSWPTKHTHRHQPAPCSCDGGTLRGVEKAQRY